MSVCNKGYNPAKARALKSLKTLASFSLTQITPNIKAARPLIVFFCQIKKLNHKIHGVKSGDPIKLKKLDPRGVRSCRILAVLIDAIIEDDVRFLETPF